ncbi:TOM (translocase of outer membrane) complex component [Geranomyces michiganensis]|nr:TOM (translocase of outer membrane) complex component [Geranomyces michiganensis]
MSTTKAPEAAMQRITPSQWKSIAAVAVAGVVVGAGAWYILSQRPSDKTKRHGDGGKRAAGAMGAKKKSAGGSGKGAKSAAAGAGGKTNELRDSQAPSLDDVDSPTPSVTAVNGSGANEKGYPAHLFPADVGALSEKERAALAKEAKGLGNTFFAERKYDQAIDLYSQAIAFKPDAVFYSNRAACYSNLGDYDKVIEDCTASLELDSVYVKALNRRAQAYERKDRLVDALNDYTVMCVLEEFANETVLVATDRVLKQIAHAKAAIQMETRVPRLPSDTFIAAFMDSFTLTGKGAGKVVAHVPETKGDKLVQDAYRAVVDRKWADAQTAAAAAVESGDLSAYYLPLAYNLRATFAFLRGDVDAAFNDLETALEANPNDINSIIKRASIFMERADVERAAAEYDRAIATDPKHADTYYHRGQIRVLTGDNQGAVEDYKRSIELDASFVYAHIQLGVALYKLGDVQGAVDTFRNAEKRFKKSGEVFNYHGEILLDTQQYEEAIKNFDKAIQMMPDSPLPHINKAILYLQWRQDPVTAETECRKAIAVDPLCDMAYAQLAQLLLHQGKFEESLDAYDHASKLARTEPELANALALREAAAAQLHVSRKYPAVIAKLRGTM